MLKKAGLVHPALADDQKQATPAAPAAQKTQNENDEINEEGEGDEDT